MNRLGFNMVRLVARCIANTPWSLLYIKSDVYRFILYHVVRYRRKVVRTNLVNAFPDKTKSELKRIERNFYRNLCDVAVESCKMMKMTQEVFDSRVSFDNTQIIKDLYDKGKDVFMAMPHSGNWEWFGKSMKTVSSHHAMAIYKKLEDPYFERFMLDLRSMGKLEDERMIESRVALKILAARSNVFSSVLFIADQSPQGLSSDYWNRFLNQETCWFTGLEKMARRLDYAVVFVEMRREGRGRYHVAFDLICDNPSTMPEGYIMEQYARKLERFIKDNPDNWLWSHRRWKHKRMTS